MLIFSLLDISYYKEISHHYHPILALLQNKNSCRNTRFDAQETILFHLRKVGLFICYSQVPGHRNHVGKPQIGSLIQLVMGRILISAYAVAHLTAPC